MAQPVKNPPEMQETPDQFLGQEDSWRRDRLPTPVFLGFPGGSAGKESACSVGDPGSIPGLERFPAEGNGNPLQYSCLENPMDREAWWATVHRVSQLDTSETTKQYIFTYLEKKRNSEITINITKYRRREKENQ